MGSREEPLPNAYIEQIMIGDVAFDCTVVVSIVSGLLGGLVSALRLPFAHPKIGAVISHRRFGDPSRRSFHRVCYSRRWWMLLGSRGFSRDKY
jgi:hypothetical protein